MKNILLLTLALVLISYTSAAGHMRTDSLMSHIDWTKLCKNWDEEQQQCIECFEGCTKWHNICVYVVKNCHQWDQTGNCIMCQKGYGSDTGMSINGTCPEKQNPILTSPPPPITGNQTDIDINCQCHNDDRVCIDCYAGYYLDMDAFCMELPENCTAADVFGNCTSCMTGMIVENGTCVPQQCDLSLCVRFNEDQTQCLQCPNRSYLQDGCCWEVNGNCKEWIPETGVCLQCFTGYKVNKNDDKECILDPTDW